MAQDVFKTAHGTAADGGAVLVAEEHPVDEQPPLDAAQTAAGLALRRVRGRPFQLRNTAASGRGPSLTRVSANPTAPEDQRRIERRATSLQRTRDRELSIQHGGYPLSAGVKAELKAWALASAWADHFYRAGDAVKGAALAEKASGFHLKAVGHAAREAAARPTDDFAAEVARANAEAEADAERQRAAARRIRVADVPVESEEDPS